VSRFDKFDSVSQLMLLKFETEDPIADIEPFCDVGDV